MKTPAPRVTRMSLYSPGDETASYRGKMWIESETFAYPGDTFTRRAYVVLRANPHNPIALSYGKHRVVLCKVPDSFYTVPARLRVKGKTIAGYVTVSTGEDELSFTPNADPIRCPMCRLGDGCRKDVKMETE